MSSRASTPQGGSIASTPFALGAPNNFPAGRLYQDDDRLGTSADNTIPSIESSSDNSFGDGSTSDKVVHSRTPSVSLSPPTEPNYDVLRSAEDKGKAVLREGCGSNSVSARISNMRLGTPDSSLNMSDVAAAIEDVVAGSDSQVPVLETVILKVPKTPSSRRLSGRRSSSQKSSQPHKVEDEEPPQDRFHAPYFQQAFGNAKGSHQRFVGDSGVGKSSLLNSLLDTQALARTSNSGAACTCVVTEYHFHDSNNFAIEVDLFNADEIRDQLIELLQSYRHYHLHTETMDEEEKRAIEQKANMAQDTFRAMFRGQLDNEQFLTEMTNESALAILMSYAQEKPPISERESTSTLVECSELLMRLTSEQTSPQGPALWPYIRKIKVFLNAHILRNGLVLVDLPGLHDLNSARRNITERYLLHCDEIFAICYIGRVTTDAGVESVFELATQAMLSNVGIICTKSDDIQAEEAKKDWKGQKARTIERHIAAVVADQQDLERIEEELAEYADASTDDDMLEEEKDCERELHRRSRDARKRMNDHGFELKNYLIQTRNNSVVQRLDEIYTSRLPSARLRVFCVSNKDYWNHRLLPKDDKLSPLELSGIIAVRKHCISIVANSQLRIATKYIRSDIPALLSDIQLWIQSGAGTMDAERKRLVRDTLNTLEVQLKRHTQDRRAFWNSKFIVRTSYGVALPILQPRVRQVVFAEVFSLVANITVGAKSDSRRKGIVNRKLSQESLFEDLTREFKKTFKDLARVLQKEMQNAVATHLDVIRGTLDIIRSENVTLESERDPGFRSRLEGAVRTANSRLEQIQAIVDDGANSTV
ncbi:hypothetical protein BP6252_06540 [Coleophoma cylindrospora]|uniref:Dynamin N-terminal domain-containing protein n=1 Tax=Coleophoma cylindrospora TaxID=1849047 RepID=A0A3D8RN83_9HELO|nr:hypothetical protein BP6252_06540 [Coleophoma cylindrospora]